MTVWAVVAASVVPGIFWIGYFYHHDRHRPEPAPGLALTYLLGLLGGLACFRIYDFIPAAPVHDRVLFLGYAVGVIGVVEEAAKFVPFIVVCRRLRAFDEEIDGVVYASVIALGFATVENFVLLGELAGAEFYGRALASPLVHTVFSSIWGVACARAKIAGRSLFRPAAAGLAIAAVAHGVYDFLATDELVRPTAAAVILGAWLWRLRVKRRARAAALAAAAGSAHER